MEEKKDATAAGKGQGCVEHVKFTYFELLGRADPIQQMFEYHGQSYEKEAL